MHLAFHMLQNSQSKANKQILTYIKDIRSTERYVHTLTSSTMTRISKKKKKKKKNQTNGRTNEKKPHIFFFFLNKRVDFSLAFLDYVRLCCDSLLHRLLCRVHSCRRKCKYKLFLFYTGVINIFVETCLIEKCLLMPLIVRIFIA